MENPLNPLDNQDPLDNTNPMDDPMLDAFERSMENPPGFIDPVVERDEFLMDDLARQLDQVEAGIENTPLGPADPDTPDNGIEPDTQDDGLVDSISSGLPDGFGTPEIEEVSDVSPFSGTNRTAGRDPFVGSSSTGHSIPIPPPSGYSKRRTGISPERRGNLRHGRTGARASHDARICPDSHERVDERTCELCEKYHHWPEGTDEEPRECWYDWQGRLLGEDSDSDNADGD